MRLPPNFKFTFFKNQNWVKYGRNQGVSYYFQTAFWPIIGTLVLLSSISIVQALSPAAYAPIVEKPNGNETGQADKTKILTELKPLTPIIHGGSSPDQKSLAMTHLAVVSTIFWVGEPAGEDNNFIANSASAWDEHWQASYGGVDDPDSRSGYLPAGFTPKENPFYVALPYNDLTNSGGRKNNAGSCPLHNPESAYSWCKNSWVGLRHATKIAYAQWEDAGPNESDDFAYVFGNAAPKNNWGQKAGIDVSPAVRDFLGLADVDRVDWAFVSENQVPSGAWKQIITTSKGYAVSN